MTALIQSLTVCLLLGWPTYNLVIAILAWRPTRLSRHVGPSSDFHFWLIIPALNEAKVIERTVNAALALDGPGTPVRVLVVDDASDDETPDILARLAHPRLHVIRREMPLARQGKGEALNAGYRAIRASIERREGLRNTIVGIVDGDGRGDPHLLREVASLFADDEVGAVQSRVRITNRHKILGMLQDIEFACVANASQSLRDHLDSVGLGGNGQFVRLRDLARLGRSPWSACLVEDLELGLRLHLQGVVVRYTSRAAVHQQAVVRPLRLLRQRTRWAQGNLQCSRYVRALLRSRHIGSLGLLDYLVYLLAPWMTIPSTILVLAAMALAIVSLSTGETFGGLMAGRSGIEWAVGVWVSALFAPGLLWGTFHRLRVADEPLGRCLLAGFCYPGFLLLGTIATWRAVVRHSVHRQGWAKTDREADAPMAPAGRRVGTGTVPVPRPRTVIEERAAGASSGTIGIRGR